MCFQKYFHIQNPIYLSYALAIFDSVISIIMFIGEIKLLIYLYRKGLSEFWYAHKLLWILNLLIDLV